MATSAPRPLNAPPTSSDEDGALLASLRRAEPEAFEHLVRRHGGPMLAVIRRILRNDADAADALQDAFLSAFKSIGGFGGEAKLSTWLHRIAVNAALMKLRSRKRRHEESIDELLPRFKEDGHAIEPSLPWEASPTELLERAESRELVRKLVDELPETYRVALLLRDIEELDTEEVARLLGITPNAVKIRVHRGRQALRTRLDEQFRWKVPA